MADSPVRGAGPVGPLGGFGARQGPPHGGAPRHGSAPPRPTAVDRVSVGHGAATALLLLRERVLAATRSHLQLGESVALPQFAEVAEGEPVAAFLGRLLSAQNQLAALRAGRWPAERVREALAGALQEGAAETLELLAADAAATADGLAAVGEVLAEFGRRLATWVGELPEAGPPA